MKTDPTELTDRTAVRLQPLARRRWLQSLANPAAVLLALLIGAGLIALTGVSPLKAYGALLDGALGNRNSLAETLVKAVPLALAGVGVSIAFRAGVFNVGAEGQLFMGAMAAAYVSLQLHGQFGPLPMILAAMLAGGLWAGIAALLKLWFNASEMINTIMLNYIAIFFIGYLLHGPLQEPGSPLGQTAPIPEAAKLAILLPGTRLHAGLLLAILAAVVCAILLWRTTWGFRLRVVGKNQAAARNAGMNVALTLFSTLVVSGALAGLAGFAEVSGVQHRMIENISPGYGYTAIVVALLGQTNPLGVLIAAVLFAALQVGARTMESAVHVPSSAVTIIQYLVVILIIGREGFGWLQQQIRRRQNSA